MKTNWIAIVLLLPVLAAATYYCESLKTLLGFENPEVRHAQQHIEYYGCASCHVVPGVAGADGLIGPSLQGIANRPYLGGVVKNSPDKLIQWIKDAPSLDPLTAMPKLEIPDEEARQIAGYLSALR